MAIVGVSGATVSFAWQSSRGTGVNHSCSYNSRFDCWRSRSDLLYCWLCCCRGDGPDEEDETFVFESYNPAGGAKLSGYRSEEKSLTGRGGRALNSVVRQAVQRTSHGVEAKARKVEQESYGD